MLSTTHSIILIVGVLLFVAAKPGAAAPYVPRAGIQTAAYYQDALLMGGNEISLTERSIVLSIYCSEGQCSPSGTLCSYGCNCCSGRWAPIRSSFGICR